MNNEKLHEALVRVYGPEAASEQMIRYQNADSRFTELFGEGERSIFRAPGRIEIGGNHTDHQHGKVLAAAIDLDVAAVAAASREDLIRIYSEGFGWIEADLSLNEAAVPGTAESLVIGVAEEMRKRGFKAGGIRAYVTSNVPEGSGLSSSAAFEVLVGTILNRIYNDEGSLATPGEMARIAQTAENRYYGKPCGLMDQMASATGGLCLIDFKDPESPVIEKLETSFDELGYCICITNTHGSHADFTDDYAAVQTELARAAEVFGKEVIEGVSTEDVIDQSTGIRDAGGDRAFLRAMHIASENERVLGEANALKRGDIAAFLELVRRSGDSSYKFLQNVHVDRTPERQELAVALAISEAVLGRGKGGACRVHGGGFAGTILAFVSAAELEDYRKAMDSAFGEGSCCEVRICPEGGVRMNI